MSATPRGDLPRNEGWRNFPYGPQGGHGNYHARKSILAIRFAGAKQEDDIQPLLDAIEEAAQARMRGDVIPGSRDRTLNGKDRRGERRYQRSLHWALLAEMERGAR